MNIGPSTGAWLTSSGHIFKENWFSLSRSHQQLLNWGQGFMSTSRSMAGCWSAWSCSGFVQVTTAAVSSWMQWTCYVQKMLFWPSPPQPLALTVLTSSLLWRSSSLGVGWGRVRHKHPNYRRALHWHLLSACWPHLTPFKGPTKGWVHKPIITNLYGRCGTYEDITVDNRYIGQHKGDENRGMQNQSFMS